MAYTSRYTLPSHLDARILGRSHAALNHLKVDGTRVRYIGPGDDDSQAATIRTNAPAPPDCPLYYFEVEVISSGYRGFIGIGFQTDDVLLSRLPGWDPHSYGYHGDDGNAFQGSGSGRPYGPTYGTGDIMGALLNRADRTISFFKNGQSLGVAFRGVSEDRLFPCVGLRTKDEELNLNLGGEKRSSMKPGKFPFVADFESMQEAFRAKVVADVGATPLPMLSRSGTPLIPQLLYDHLMHHRYWRTAAAIQHELLPPTSTSSTKQATTTSAKHTCDSSGAQPSQQDVDMAEGGAPSPMEVSAGSMGAQHEEQKPSLTSKQRSLEGGQQESSSTGRGAASEEGRAALPNTIRKLLDMGMPSEVAVRQACYELVLSGQMEETQETLDACFGPGLLQSQPSLNFRLHVAQFCHILKTGGPGAVEQALAYGRQHLTPQQGSGSKGSRSVDKLSPDEQELLGDALSLLAYDNPETAPAGHLLGQGQRTLLAEAVNCAILAHQGAPATSPLERLSRQALAATQALRERNHPYALMLDAQAFVFGT